MIVHICDCCKKQSQEYLSLSLPMKEEIEIKNLNQYYETGKLFLKEVELCPECAKILADFIALLFEDRKVEK